eukprot:9486031-Pyramimonas_sp.AAC.1
MFIIPFPHLTIHPSQEPRDTALLWATGGRARESDHELVTLMKKVFDEDSLPKDADPMLKGGYHFAEFDAAVERHAFNKAVFCFVPEED